MHRVGAKNGDLEKNEKRRVIQSNYYTDFVFSELGTSDCNVP